MHWSNKKYLVYFTLTQFLHYKIHLGVFSCFLDSTLNFYSLVKFFNFIFFNLNYTIINFKLILNLLFDFISKRASILLCSNQVHFCKNFHLFYINYLFNNWLPGLLTNFKQVKKFVYFSFIKKLKYKNLIKKLKNMKVFYNNDKKKYFFFIKFFYLKLFKSSGYNFEQMENPPFFLFFSNFLFYINACKEAFKLNIPFSNFLDLNLNSFFSSYFIPGNSNTLKSQNFYFYILFKVLFNGINLEKLKFLFLIQKNYSSFFFKSLFSRQYSLLLDNFFNKYLFLFFSFFVQNYYFFYNYNYKNYFYNNYNFFFSYLFYNYYFKLIIYFFSNIIFFNSFYSFFYKTFKSSFFLLYFKKLYFYNYNSKKKKNNFFKSNSLFFISLKINSLRLKNYSKFDLKI